MEDYVYSKIKRKRKKKSKKILLFLSLLFLVAFVGLFFFFFFFTISEISEQPKESEELKGYIKNPLPEDDPNRINILLLGMRGLNDPGNGKLLTDTIVIASIKKDTGEVALISLPRDLYVQLWCHQDKKKINFAYFEGGLDCSKKTISHVTGLHIDHSVVVNFEGLKDIVDALGGITIHRDTSFTESVQWAKEGKPDNKYWFIKEFKISSSTKSLGVTTTSTTTSNNHLNSTSTNNIANSTSTNTNITTTTPQTEERWVFYVPSGKNVLDGETALYYVRSRYTSNDFERIKRQQQVLIALKDKIISLGFLTNPVKIYNFLDAIGNNLKTDIKMSEIKNLLKLSSALKNKNIKTRNFDTESNGLLYDTFINKQYVLLPENNNFDEIRKICKNIFKEDK